MLDFDLARIYGYETRTFNQQVKNNIEKFPPDFMFQLTTEEVDEISRCKNSTTIKSSIESEDLVISQNVTSRNAECEKSTNSSMKSEEITRLKSHVSQLKQIVEQENSGKKLDFLAQEFNREANTIGSKCSDLEIARTVVDMKAELEKIREQIQNIE